MPGLLRVGNWRFNTERIEAVEVCPADGRGLVVRVYLTTWAAELAGGAAEAMLRHLHDAPGGPTVEVIERRDAA